MKQFIHNDGTIQNDGYDTSKYLRTTTIGLSLLVRTIRPFQIIRADETIIAKFRN